MGNCRILHGQKGNDIAGARWDSSSTAFIIMGQPIGRFPSLCCAEPQHGSDRNECAACEAKQLLQGFRKRRRADETVRQRISCEGSGSSIDDGDDELGGLAAQDLPEIDERRERQDCGGAGDNASDNDACAARVRQMNGKACAASTKARTHIAADSATAKRIIGVMACSPHSRRVATM